jgi:hypothetical protein
VLFFLRCAELERRRCPVCRELYVLFGVGGISKVPDHSVAKNPDDHDNAGYYVAYPNWLGTKMFGCCSCIIMCHLCRA